jgi:hypothetical protein
MEESNSKTFFLIAAVLITNKKAAQDDSGIRCGLELNP